MSKPAVAALALVVIAAGGYSAFWYKSANDVKNTIISSTAEFNDKMKPLVKNAEFFHYDSIETSGFPFALKVTFTKPVITAPVDTLLRMLPPDPSNPSKIPADFSWLDVMSLGNQLVVDSNLVGSEFTVHFDNSFTQKNLVNGQPHHGLTAEYASPFTCHVKTAPTGFLGAKEIHADLASLLTLFHSADCDAAGMTMKDAESGTTLATGGKHSFSVSHIAANNNRAMALKMQSEDFTYTSAFDAVVSDIMQTIAQAMGKPVHPLPYSFGELGKSNFKMDMAYNGPDSSGGFSSSTVKAAIDVNTLELSSALINFGLQFHMALDTTGGEQNSSLIIHAKANVSDRYDQVLATQTKQIIADMGDTNGKSDKGLQTAQDIARLGPPDTVVATVLPHLHPFGDMAFDLDTAIHGPKEQAALLARGHFVLNALNILTTPYGIKSSGELHGTPSMAPTGNANLTCLNCDALISDAGDYLIRVSNFMDALHPDKKVNHPTKAYYDGIKAFAHSIALNGSDAAAKDLNFTVVAKDNGEYTISNKPLMEVMQSYMTNIAANTPTQPAPAQIPNQQLPALVQPQQ